LNEVQPVANRADDFELAFQQTNALPEHGGMIIREQQPGEFGNGVH